jgi:hypothetical protein
VFVKGSPCRRAFKLVRVFAPKRHVFNNFYRLRGVVRHIDAQEEEKKEREREAYLCVSKTEEEEVRLFSTNPKIIITQ